MTKIQIKEVFLGTHNWPSCDLPNVEFLKFEHHHQFEFLVQADVSHSDRAVEFLVLHAWVRDCILGCFPYPGNITRFGSMSCEQLSEFLMEKLNDYWGKEFNWQVSVSEDGQSRGGVW